MPIDSFCGTVPGMADTLHDYKMRFASTLQRYVKSERMQYAAVVAKQVIGKEQCEQYPMYLIKASEEWPNDSEVVAEIERLDLIPPTLEMAAAVAWSIANGKNIEVKNRVLAIGELRQMFGWGGSKNKEGISVNEFLVRLQNLDTAVRNPVDT